jgi:hypothetical protein
MDAIEATSHQKHPDFGMVVLNCLRELENRPFWTALSGQKRAAGHVLAALSTLQLRPYLQLSDDCSSSILSKQVRSVCLVRILTEVWHVACRNVARLHLLCVGAFASTPPPPDWVVPVHSPFCLRRTDVERPYIDVHGRYVLYVGDGHVQCIDWVKHARYHLPTQYFITILKLKFQTYFEIILNGTRCIQNQIEILK